MQAWDPLSDKVSKIRPDKEKAKSLLQVVALRKKDLETKPLEFTTLIVEGCYEVVKELITALMSIDGYKTVSHELLVGYLAEYYKAFSFAEITLIDQLRKTRNDIAYRGIMVPQEYLQRNRKAITAVIQKLQSVVEKKLETPYSSKNSGKLTEP